MKRPKFECEKELVDYILKIGLRRYSEMDEKGNTYYVFKLDNGELRYWKNLSQKNRESLGMKD